MKHLIIPDTQVRAGVALNHIRAAGNYIVSKQPEKIFIMGDWWDLPSLSSYNTPLQAEGLRLLEDINAGNVAMDLLFKPLQAFNKGRRRKYKPEVHFIPGNHCDRLQRKINQNPELEGILGGHLMNMGKYCIVHPYLEPTNQNGFWYSHFFYNPKTGRPYGGTARTKLTNLKFSFVQGHVQEFDYCRQHLNNGQVLVAIVAGAFYMHDEEYIGPQGDHWRGLVMLHDVRDGNAAICEVQLDYLLRKYL